MTAKTERSLHSGFEKKVEISLENHQISLKCVHIESEKNFDYGDRKKRTKEGGLN